MRVMTNVPETPAIDLFFILPSLCRKVHASIAALDSASFLLVPTPLLALLIRGFHSRETAGQSSW